VSVFLAATDSGLVHGFLTVSTGALVVAFVAQLMRVPAKRERKILEGDPPNELTLRGIRPAKSSSWWPVTWFVSTLKGWENVDRFLRSIAIAGLVICVLAFLLAIIVK
jgi:hypothetical protein